MPNIAAMSHSIKPLKPDLPSFAAEVSGVDCRETPTPEVVAFIEDAMAEHAVCVLRDQTMTDEQHAEWSKYFGPRESPSGPVGGNPGNVQRLPEFIFDASNILPDGEIWTADHPRRPMRMGDRLWHTDSSFNPQPTKWSMLHGIEVPPVTDKGTGNTDFADCRAAYDGLPAKTKKRLEGLVAVHSIWHSRIKGGLDPDDITEAMHQSNPPAYHPIVRAIPRPDGKPGRTAMMLGAHVRGIVGWPDDEAQAFVDELVAHATQDKYVYSHAWRVGDAVIWDNRCTLHRATPFDDLAYRRDMRRTTIDEYRPAWSAAG